jgi:hypothetical protein
MTKIRAVSRRKAQYNKSLEKVGISNEEISFKIFDMFMSLGY